MSSGRCGLVFVLVAACGPTPTATDAGTLDGARDDVSSPRDAAGDACTICPPEPVDFVLALADPFAPARRLPGRAFLRSSRQPEPQPGMRNADFANFVRMNDGRGVMAEEIGPGVITRIWLTYGPPMVGSVVDLPMRLIIDGVEVPLDGSLDVPLGRLASGDVPGFPLPWVMGPSVASGGLVLSVPIQYQESARLEITYAPGSLAYYQIDGRSLPLNAQVRSFTAVPRAEHIAALTAARELWLDHAHPGEDRVLAPAMVAPGASIDLDVSGPAAITTLEVASDVASRAQLHVSITIDGETAVDAPLAWLTGSSFPAGSYSAGLTASSPLSAVLYAPLPIRTSGHITITNETGAATSIGVTTRVLMGAIPSDVGRFRAECVSVTGSAPTEVIEGQTDLEYPNTILGESVRGPGQFAGLTTFQTVPGAWWFALEPDHEIAVDGVYDLLGTGTEDYFGGAFYFQNGPYASVTSGASGWDRDTNPTQTHLYRHHILDTIPFDHDFRFEMESYMPRTRFDSCMFTYLF